MHLLFGVLAAVATLALLSVLDKWLMKGHIHLWEVKDKDYKNGLVRLKCNKCGMEDWVPLNQDK